MSIIVLIAGVVLLTHKKPEPVTGKIKSTAPRRRKQRKGGKGAPGTENGNGIANGHAEGELETRGSEGEVLWAVGEESDEHDEDDEGLDDDIDHHQHPIHNKIGSAQILGQPGPVARRGSDEYTGLVARGEDGEDEDDDDGWVKQGRVMSAANDERRHRRSMDPFRDVDDDAHELDEVIGRPKR